MPPMIKQFLQRNIQKKNEEEEENESKWKGSYYDKVCGASTCENPPRMVQLEEVFSIRKVLRKVLY